MCSQIFVPDDLLVDSSFFVDSRDIPSITLSVDGGFVYLYFAFIQAPISVSSLNIALSALSQPEQLRYQSFEDYYQGTSFLVGRQLARYGISRLLGCSSKAVSIELDQLTGKPFTPHTYFNLSRSGPFVACAVSATHNLGIDIEVIKTDVDIASVNSYLSNFFLSTDLEWRAHISSYHSFYNQWTRLESQLKLSGAGFSDTQSSVPISSIYQLNFACPLLTGCLCLS